MRRGSYYNILGPDGRLFSKYRSASTVGPRWEEVTRTPWPYSSSAYESGQRLWELGLIPRDQIGQTALASGATISARATPVQANSARKMAVRPVAQPAPQSMTPPAFVPVIAPDILLALPAPRLDLATHERMMAALRRDPSLVFQSPVKQALRQEVAYHRPQARWAQHLLDLLTCYERREYVRARTGVHWPHSPEVLAKHLAWQEQQRAVRDQSPRLAPATSRRRASRRQSAREVARV